MACGFEWPLLVSAIYIWDCLKCLCFSGHSVAQPSGKGEESKKSDILWAIKGLYQLVPEQAGTPLSSAAPGEKSHRPSLWSMFLSIKESRARKILRHLLSVIKNTASDHFLFLDIMGRWQEKQKRLHNECSQEKAIHRQDAWAWREETAASETHRNATQSPFLPTVVGGLGGSFFPPRCPWFSRLKLLEELRSEKEWNATCKATWQGAGTHTWESLKWRLLFYSDRQRQSMPNWKAHSTKTEGESYAPAAVKGRHL